MGMFYINNTTRKKTKRKPGWQKEAAEYDEWLKKHNAHPTQRNRKKEKPEVYTQSKVYTRETPYYPSLNATSGSTAKVEPQKYSGDYFVGIATMHKSNLVPVGREQDARDYATMRRN